MKKYLSVLIGLILSSCSNGQIENAENGIDISNTQISKEQPQLIFDKIKTFPNNTELSIALINKGEVNFIGIKRTNDTLKTVENFHSAFEIGSITKVFTATLLSNLVLEEKLDLDESIQNHFDFELKTKEKITFKELANHTSGLPRLPSNVNFLTVDKDNPYKNYDQKKLIEYLTQKMKLNQKPGLKYEYSNLGAGILGYQLTQVSKSTFEYLLQNRIFNKYNMSNSTSQRGKIESKIVKGLDNNGKVTSNWDFDVLAGGGAILSNTEDLSKFALAHFNNENKELLLTQKPTFKINENLSIGLGWHIVKGENDNELLWHNGGTGGYTSSMALNVTTKQGIIILSNISAYHDDMGFIDELCFGLMRTLHQN